MVRERKCTSCELPTTGARCPGGSQATVALLDRRPILLSEELRQLVERALDGALREATAGADATRCRLLKTFVVPHYMAVLRDHETAARRQRQLRTGSWRELTGTPGEQLQRLSRIGYRMRRPAARATGGHGRKTSLELSADDHRARLGVKPAGADSLGRKWSR